jgi:prepilin-type N-terminal cleavage/methylation domain-containing protein
VTADDRSDDGFTLIELMVVLVIMPLIVGAIAAAIIVSLQDSITTKARLTDSSNAQITSTFYVGDVQGAQFVTTDATIDFPKVCVKPPLPGSPRPTLVLGLYRIAITSPPLSVGYWVTNGPTPQLVRDSCSVPQPGADPVFSTEAILSDDISPAGVSVAILPSEFATAAATGWMATLTSTAPIASISGINLSVAEPGSNYTFNLLATPRVWTSQPAG